MILAAAVFRLLPHPPNFTPIGAMALVAGATFPDRRMAFLLPLLAMILSDWFLGFSVVTPFVYASLMLGTCAGFWIRSKRSLARVFYGALASSVFFFIITNFGVWLLFDYYPKTNAGLALCYMAAIPFFQNTVAGDLVFSGTLFGALWLAEKRWQWMREPSFALRA